MQVAVIPDHGHKFILKKKTCMAIDMYCLDLPHLIWTSKTYTGKVAEMLLKLFQDVAQNIGKSKEGKYLHHFVTLHINLLLVWIE